LPCGDGLADPFGTVPGGPRRRLASMSVHPAASPGAGTTGPHANADAHRGAPENSLWLRVLLVVGTTLTAVSFGAMVLLLASYFLNVTAWPVFYWFGLYGLPLGFALMLAYVVSKAVLRRRA
jgi:uncharacterized membrane protein